jgi:hypothetical protein
VAEHFSGDTPDEKICLSYASGLPAKNVPEGTVTESMQYRVREGVVTTISVSQATAR